jgi:hypothetical protein
MLKSLSSLSTMICSKESLEQENSALRAKVDALEKERLAFLTERDNYYGRVTELLVHLQEALEEHPELVDLSRKANLLEAWSADFWLEKHSVSHKRLALIYLRSMQLHSLISQGGDSDGSKDDYQSPCSRRTGRRVG